MALEDVPSTESANKQRRKRAAPISPESPSEDTVAAIKKPKRSTRRARHERAITQLTISADLTLPQGSLNDEALLHIDIGEQQSTLASWNRARWNRALATLRLRTPEPDVTNIIEQPDIPNVVDESFAVGEAAQADTSQSSVSFNQAIDDFYQQLRAEDINMPWSTITERFVTKFRILFTTDQIRSRFEIPTRKPSATSKAERQAQRDQEDAFFKILHAEDPDMKWLDVAARFEANFGQDYTNAQLRHRYSTKTFARPRHTKPEQVEEDTWLLADVAANPKHSWSTRVDSFRAHFGRSKTLAQLYNRYNTLQKQTRPKGTDSPNPTENLTENAIKESTKTASNKSLEEEDDWIIGEMAVNPYTTWSEKAIRFEQHFGRTRSHESLRMRWYNILQHRKSSDQAVAVDPDGKSVARPVERSIEHDKVQPIEQSIGEDTEQITTKPGKKFSDPPPRALDKAARLLREAEEVPWLIAEKASNSRATWADIATSFAKHFGYAKDVSTLARLYWKSLESQATPEQAAILQQKATRKSVTKLPSATEREIEDGWLLSERTRDPHSTYDQTRARFEERFGRSIHRTSLIRRHKLLLEKAAKAGTKDINEAPNVLSQDPGKKLMPRALDGSEVSDIHDRDSQKADTQRIREHSEKKQAQPDAATENADFGQPSYSVPSVAPTRRMYFPVEDVVHMKALRNTTHCRINVINLDGEPYFQMIWVNRPLQDDDGEDLPFNTDIPGQPPMEIPVKIPCGELLVSDVEDLVELYKACFDTWHGGPPTDSLVMAWTTLILRNIYPTKAFYRPEIRWIEGKWEGTMQMLNPYSGFKKFAPGVDTVPMGGTVNLKIDPKLVTSDAMKNELFGLSIDDVSMAQRQEIINLLSIDLSDDDIVKHLVARRALQQYISTRAYTTGEAREVQLDWLEYRKTTGLILVARAVPRKVSKSKSRKPKAKKPGIGRPIYGGFPLFYLYHRLSSISLRPSNTVESNVISGNMPQITVRSKRASHLITVMEAIEAEWISKHHIASAWKIGCIVADRVNQRLDSGEEMLYRRCGSENEEACDELHHCDKCLRCFPCRGLDMSYLKQLLCVDCVASAASPASRLLGLIHRSIQSSLRNENIKKGFPKGHEDMELEECMNKFRDEIKTEVAGYYRCTYTKKSLFGVITGSQRRQSATLVSVDARMPFDPRSERGYSHTASNTALTSLCLNYGKWTYIPAVLQHLADFQNSQIGHQTFIEKMNDVHQVALLNAHRIKTRQSSSNLTTEENERLWVAARIADPTPALLDLQSRYLYGIARKNWDNDWRPPCFEDMKIIIAAAEAKTSKKLRTRNDCWAFFDGEIPPTWCWQAAWKWGEQRLKTMTDECNGYFETEDSVMTILLQASLTYLMPELGDQLFAAKPLPVTLRVRDPLRLSIGKKTPNTQMVTGFTNPSPVSLDEYHIERNTISMEPWIANALKWNFDPSDWPLILDLVRSVKLDAGDYNPTLAPLTLGADLQLNDVPEHIDLTFEDEVVEVEEELTRKWNHEAQYESEQTSGGSVWSRRIKKEESSDEETEEAWEFGELPILIDSDDSEDPDTTVDRLKHDPDITLVDMPDPQTTTIASPIIATTSPEVKVEEEESANVNQEMPEPISAGVLGGEEPELASAVEQAASIAQEHEIDAATEAIVAEGAQLIQHFSNEALLSFLNPANAREGLIEMVMAALRTNPATLDYMNDYLDEVDRSRRPR